MDILTYRPDGTEKQNPEKPVFVSRTKKICGKEILKNDGI